MSIQFDCDCGNVYVYNKYIANDSCPKCYLQGSPECKGCRKFCENKKCKECYEKSFASCSVGDMNPWLYWSDKNGDITPRIVSKSSGKRYYFTCIICKHEFLARLGDVNNGGWCPYCSHRKLCDDKECIFCFDNSFASHEKAQFWSKKNKVSPRNVFKSSDNDRYYFECDICKHEFSARLNNVNKGRWCPYCSTPPKKLCDNKDCTFCFNNSFASHEKAQFWSTKNKRSPRNVFKSSDNDRYYFECNVCKHEFPAILNKINNEQWCPYCSHKKLCDDKDCSFCFDNSFASHEKAQFWSKKNKGNPRNVFKSSSKTYYFECDVCKHEFLARLDDVNNGRWCPYCSHRKLCDDKECIFCFNNSFASHEKAQFWSKKNKASPRNVFKSSGNRYYFGCGVCNHEFPARLYSVNNGRWCPLCKNKTEGKLLKFLQSSFPDIIHQFTPDWCRNEKTNRCLPFDFCIQEYKIIIELDGAQHFKDMKCWYSIHNDISDRDVYKMNQANKNGYSIIRLVQEEIWDDLYNWKETLSDTIELCKETSGIYVLSCDDDMYGNHINKINKTIV